MQNQTIQDHPPNQSVRFRARREIDYLRTDCAPALSSNATVILPGDLTLLAQNEIVLATGFTVAPGGLLTAEIAPACDTTYQYQYFLTDHTRRLGKGPQTKAVRVTFADPDTNGVADLLEEHHYYPFGLEMERWNGVGGAGVEQRFRYNGKEINDDLGLYFYGFRMYDPAIGRFTGVDPISDKFAWVSTYNYAENEPIANIDLHGLQKYFAADGSFLRQDGGSEDIRIVRSVETGFFSTLTSSEARMQTSIPAHTMDKELDVMVTWTQEERPNIKSKERGMSLFTSTVTDEDGSQIDVFVEGSTVTGPEKSRKGGAQLDINESSSPIEGWERGASIHTHPRGGSKEFSDGKGWLATGDINYAKKSKQNLYLVNYGEYKIQLFSPSQYFSKAERWYDGKIKNHNEAKEYAIQKITVGPN